MKYIFSMNQLYYTPLGGFDPLLFRAAVYDEKQDVVENIQSLSHQWPSGVFIMAAIGKGDKIIQQWRWLQHSKRFIPFS